ncbi:hypothetical protein [Telmatospirillum sp.]|uniref:hypothetical protein n=1 Tax=Telmatospirillum sp. TaxID=2079197 RepID=UPI00284D71F7|nr:hypothetical protein [Telmatospirillum sp.]MDR3440581.1 hypothetical protein [Telmatospirillum sp.]
MDVMLVLDEMALIKAIDRLSPTAEARQQLAEAVKIVSSHGYRKAGREMQDMALAVFLTAGAMDIFPVH